MKQNAPELFREFLARDGWRPQTVTFSGVTDCYQPAERRFRLTRGCLEVALECVSKFARRNNRVIGDGVTSRYVISVQADARVCQHKAVHIRTARQRRNTTRPEADVYKAAIFSTIGRCTCLGNQITNVDSRLCSRHHRTTTGKRDMSLEVKRLAGLPPLAFGST